MHDDTSNVLLQVKEELERLDDDAPVFKLVGPVLMRQELDEAKQNVQKRIEFIKGEM
jgi:prefoldin beta subunit